MTAEVRVLSRVATSVENPGTKKEATITTTWWAYTFTRPECGHSLTSSFRYLDTNKETGADAARYAGEWAERQACHSCHGLKSSSASLVAEWAAAWGCPEDAARARLDKAIASKKEATLWAAGA